MYMYLHTCTYYRYMHVVVLYPLSHIMLCYGGMLLLLPPPPPPPPPPRWHIPTPPQSIGNCVRYYYLSKKSENFKQSIRVKKRRPTLGKPQVRIQYPPSLEISCTSRIHFLAGSTSISLSFAAGSLQNTQVIGQ